MALAGRLRQTFFVAFFSLLGVVALGPTASAQFNPLDSSCEQAPDSTVCQEKEDNKETDDDGNLVAKDPVTGEDGLLMSVINILSIVVAVIAVIIIIVAGMTMTLSSGDPGKVQSSRDAIIYALVGLVVVALSRSLVIFVANSV